MIHKETVSVEMEQPVSIECDCCHAKYNLLRDEQTEPDIYESQEFHKIEFRGGYCSIFGDGAFVECHLCQKCLKKLVGKYCRITEPIV